MQIKDCVRWLGNASRGYQHLVVWCTLAGMLHVGVSLFSVYISKHLIDIVTGESGDDLGLFIGWMVACIVMQLGLSIMRSRMASRAEIKMRNEMRRKLFVHMMESQWTGREKLHSGDMLNRLEEDVATVTDALCRTVPAVLVHHRSVGRCHCIFCPVSICVLAGIILFIMPVALLFSKSYVRAYAAHVA